MFFYLLLIISEHKALFISIITYLIFSFLSFIHLFLIQKKAINPVSEV